jgi:hypothetical protein
MLSDIDYSPDPSHPIPTLDAIDVHIAWKSGGSDLVVVIATPMEGDNRSINRLLRKIQAYLEFVGSAEYDAEFGPPKPESTRIVVGVHPMSHKVVFDALEQCRPFVTSNRASLVAILLEPGELQKLYPPGVRPEFTGQAQRIEQLHG